MDTKLLADIAQMLTGRSGPEAINAARRLMRAYDAGQLNEQVSRQIGNYLSGALSVSGQQQSMQTMGPR